MSTDDAAVSGSTGVTEDVEHHLTGVAAGLAGLEAFVSPEDPARLTAEVLELGATGAGGAKRGIYSDSGAGKLPLEPEQVRTFVDRFATAAEALKQHRADE